MLCWDVKQLGKQTNDQDGMFFWAVKRPEKKKRSGGMFCWDVKQLEKKQIIKIGCFARMLSNSKKKN